MAQQIPTSIYKEVQNAKFAYFSNCVQYLKNGAGCILAMCEVMKSVLKNK